MTLCIAAVTYQGKKSRLVVSTDWKQESGFASSENQDKMSWITDQWPVLMAGTMARAVFLKDTYRTYLDSNAALLGIVRRSQIMDVLNEPLKLFKHKLADEYIGTRLGISYDTFLANGKNWLPENTFSELLANIRKMPIECQLLMPIFVGPKDDYAPFIFRVTDEMLEPCDNFAAIGSGMDIAESVLCQRGQDEYTSFARTIYNVFEAGRLASLAPPPGVGRVHTIAVFYPPNEKGEIVMKELKDSTYSLLNKKFKECGPRAVRNFQLGDEHLTEVKWTDFRP